VWVKFYNDTVLSLQTTFMCRFRILTEHLRGTSWYAAGEATCGEDLNGSSSRYEENTTNSASFTSFFSFRYWENDQHWIIPEKIQLAILVWYHVELAELRPTFWDEEILHLQSTMSSSRYKLEYQEWRNVVSFLTSFSLFISVYTFVNSFQWLQI